MSEKELLLHTGSRQIIMALTFGTSIIQKPVFMQSAVIIQVPLHGPSLNKGHL